MRIRLQQLRDASLRTQPRSERTLMRHLSFFRNHPIHLTYGVLLTFFSSLGQTFLVSLYVPYILADLGMSNSVFGIQYAIATTVSALLLMKFGDRIDTHALSPYVWKVVGLLAISSMLLGLSFHPLVVPWALLGLRFAGQGLMTHTSHTVLARHFDHDRGKALSVASLGFPLGEMVFPLVIALMIPLVGWRVSLLINAGFLLALLIPLLVWQPPDAVFPPGRNDTRRRAEAVVWVWFRDARLLRLLPSLILPSVILTAVFFYQMVLVQERAWTPEWYAMAFSGYAVSRFVFNLWGGALIDRFTAIRLYFFHHIPLIAGLVAFGVSDAPWTAVFFLGSAGITVGLGSPIKTALIAEMYGSDKIGRVRSVSSAAQVFGTALGPMIYGCILDQQVEFSSLFLGSSILLGVSLLPARGTLTSYTHK